MVVLRIPYSDGMNDMHNISVKVNDTHKKNQIDIQGWNDYQLVIININNYRLRMAAVGFRSTL